LKTDIHAKLAALHDKYPDVFYTPRSGGYWVVTRQAHIQQVVSDTEHFSTSQQQIPPVVPPLEFLPLSLDPPAHTPYRVALMRYFGPKSVSSMRDKIRALAADLVEQAARQEQFEFVRLLGAGLPVTVFMNMMGLPLERFDEFRDLVCEFFSVVPVPRRVELFQKIEEEMTALIEDRTRERRDDLVSMLLDEEVQGRRLTMKEMQSICVLLFTAGLDTVANGAAFMFYYLANRPDMQQRLVENPQIIPDFVEESLRMYGIVNTPRIVKKDVELGGVTMKRDDMVLAMLSLAGRDGGIVPNPNSFDVSRPSHPHMAFGGGPHVCAGQFLARIELRLLVEEWVKRVGEFRLTPGFEAEFRSFQVMGLSSLSLTITKRAS
jgi:cytochrome P450